MMRPPRLYPAHLGATLVCNFCTLMLAQLLAGSDTGLFIAYFLLISGIVYAVRMEAAQRNR